MDSESALGDWLAVAALAIGWGAVILLQSFPG
jgi:hypothetical protein